MSLKERLAKQVQEAAAKASADGAAARDVLKEHNEKREQDALSAAIALLEDSTIEAMVQLALSKPALGKKVGFSAVKGTLRVVQPDGARMGPVEGLGLDFPYTADPIVFQQMTRHDLIRTRLDALREQGVIATFPNLQAGSPPTVLIDFSRVV